MPTLCVDFDGVLHSYESGWQGVDVAADPPVEGAIEWLLALIDSDFEVCIYSSRSKSAYGIQAMRKWLAQNLREHFEAMYHPEPDDAVRTTIAELSFPIEKPAAFLTIDDRAICFDGDFSKLRPKQLFAFKPWNKR